MSRTKHYVEPLGDITSLKLNSLHLKQHHWDQTQIKDHVALSAQNQF